MKPLLTSRRCQWAVNASPLRLTGPLATGPPWSAQGGGLPQILLGTGWSTALPYSRTENLFTTSFIPTCHTTQSCVWCLYSPDKMADLCSPQFSLVWRTILISGRESQGSKHTVLLRHNYSEHRHRYVYFKSAVSTRSAKQSPACFLIWLINMDMWLGAVDQRVQEYCTQIQPRI